MFCGNHAKSKFLTVNALNFIPLAFLHALLLSRQHGPTILPIYRHWVYLKCKKFLALLTCVFSFLPLFSISTRLHFNSCHCIFIFIFIFPLLFASFTFDLSLLHQRLKRHCWLSFPTSIPFFCWLENPATSCMLLSCALCVLHFTLEYWSACLSLPWLILFGRGASPHLVCCCWYALGWLCWLVGRLVGCPYASWWPTSVFYFNVVICSILLVPLIETKRMRRKVYCVESGSFNFFVIFPPQITHVQYAHTHIHLPYM